MIGKKPVKVRLVFVDGGSFHSVDIDVPGKAFDRLKSGNVPPLNAESP